MEIKINLEQFKNRHLFIATPAYGGMVSDAYLKSMVGIGILFQSHGLQFTLSTIANESLITRGRNYLVAKFMSNPKYTDMLFIDADIHFKPESVIKLWSNICSKKNIDVAIAAYPKKKINWRNIKKAIVDKDVREEELKNYQSSYVLNIDKNFKEKNAEENTLLPVHDGGSGFMIFKKTVIEKMIDKWPDLHYKNDINTNPKYNKYMFALFDTLIEPKTKRYLSEDYTFCRRWQELGGVVWLDLTIELGHQGTYLFTGNLTNQINNENNKQ